MKFKLKFLLSLVCFQTLFSAAAQSGRGCQALPVQPSCAVEHHAQESFSVTDQSFALTSRTALPVPVLSGGAKQNELRLMPTSLRMSLELH